MDVHSDYVKLLGNKSKYPDLILINTCYEHIKQMDGIVAAHLHELIFRFHERVDLEESFDPNNWCIQVTSVGNQYDADHGEVVGWLNGKFKKYWRVRLGEYYGMKNGKPDNTDTPFAQIITFEQFKALLVFTNVKITL